MPRSSEAAGGHQDVPDVQVVLAPGETLKRGHMLQKIARVWAEEGRRVAFGAVASLDARVGILHVDRTVIDPALVPANPDGRPFLNGTILDISKRRFSRHIVDRASGWDGPVIVKTDANAYGHYEMGRRPGLAKLRSRLAGHLSWRLLRELPRRSYPIVKSVRDVPGWVWERPDLLVERFLPERAGDRYVLRMWLFFGDREYGAILYSPDPIVKTGPKIDFEYTFEFPDSIRALRRSIGIDYGKFDYVMVDGEAVVLDVNRTPSVRAGPITENVRRLAGGLERYLEGS